LDFIDSLGAFPGFLFQKFSLNSPRPLNYLVRGSNNMIFSTIFRNIRCLLTFCLLSAALGLAGCGPGGDTATSTGAPDPGENASQGTDAGVIGPDGKAAKTK
jgi:hypothetical protein